MRAMRRSTLAKSSIEMCCGFGWPGPGLVLGRCWCWAWRCGDAVRESALAPRRRSGGRRQRFAVGGDQGLDLLRVDALHQVLVGVDQVGRRQQVAGVGPVQRRDVEEFLGALRQPGQHRLEVDGQQAEGVDQQRADLVQLGFLALLLGQRPGLVLVHVLVDLVGQRHDAAQGAGVVARLVVPAISSAGLDQAGQFGAEASR
jgi:hypothetical protein